MRKKLRKPLRLLRRSRKLSPVSKDNTMDKLNCIMIITFYIFSVMPERFNLRKLNDLEVRKQYQIEITNRYAALENVSEDEDINRAWGSIKENIKTSGTESLGMHERKQYKPWFDEECLVMVDQRKQAKIQWIQDPSQSNVDNLNSFMRDASRHFRNKKKAYLKPKLRNGKLTVRSTISGTCIGVLMTSRRGISLELG
jgi:hypothetical protein